VAFRDRSIISLMYLLLILVSSSPDLYYTEGEHKIIYIGLIIINEQCYSPYCCWSADTVPPNLSSEQIRLWNYGRSQGTPWTKRPDRKPRIPRRRGRYLAWDATYPDTYAHQSYVQATSRQASLAETGAEMKKQQDICAGVGLTELQLL